MAKIRDVPPELKQELFELITQTIAQDKCYHKRVFLELWRDKGLAFAQEYWLKLVDHKSAKVMETLQLLTEITTTVYPPSRR